MTFQYNSNARYSTEDLASINSTVDLVTQKINRNESESVQLKFMDILKDHEIIPDIEKNRHSYDGDSRKLSNKVFIALHSRKPKLEEYFHMYRPTELCFVLCIICFGGVNATFKPSEHAYS